MSDNKTFNSCFLHGPYEDECHVCALANDLLGSSHPQPEVKRYAKILDWDAQGYLAKMVEREYGDYVLYSDYAAKCARLERIDNNLTEINKVLDRYAAELGVVRKERDANKSELERVKQERDEAIGWKEVQARFADEKPRCKPNDHHWTNPRADGSNECLVCGMPSGAPSERELANFRAYEAELSRWSKRAEAAESQLSTMREALEKIAHPIAYFQKEAAAKGYDVNGTYAVQMSESANYLKTVAAEVLASLNGKGE